MPRQCWICFSEEGEVESREKDDDMQWIRPCNCRGSTRWVHHECLLSWIVSTSSSMTSAPQCPQCHYKYRITQKWLLPHWLLRVLDFGAHLGQEALLYGSIVGLVSGVYVVSAVYGGGVVWAVMGGTEINRLWSLLHNSSVWYRSMACIRVSIGIPLIAPLMLSLRYRSLFYLQTLTPLFLVEDSQSLRLTWPLPASSICFAIPFIADAYSFGLKRWLLPRLKSYFMPELLEEEEEKSNSSTSSALYSPVSSPISFGFSEWEDDDVTWRVGIEETTALLTLPFAGALVGRFLFGDTRMSRLMGSLVGSALLVVGRDLYRAISWYQSVLTRKTRRILNFQPARN